MREDNTTSTSTSKSYTLKTNFNSTCKYRLPCGICDRTGSFCTDFSYPYYPTWDDPYFPNWDKITCAQGVTYAEGTAVEPGSIKSETATAK